MGHIPSSNESFPLPGIHTLLQEPVISNPLSPWPRGRWGLSRRGRQPRSPQNSAKAEKERMSRTNLNSEIVRLQNAIEKYADPVFYSHWKPLNDNNKANGLQYNKRDILKTCLDLFRHYRDEIMQLKQENEYLRECLARGQSQSPEATPSPRLYPTDPDLPFKLRARL